MANGLQHRRGSALDRRPSSAAERSRGSVRSSNALSIGGRAAPGSTLSSVKALYGPCSCMRNLWTHPLLRRYSRTLPTDTSIYAGHKGLSVSASFSGSSPGVTAQRSAPVLRNSWEGPSTSGDAVSEFPRPSELLLAVIAFSLTQ